jgi:hypothetical protein
MIGLWLLLACTNPLSDVQPTQSWEVLSTHRDGSLLDVRFSQGNTGMLVGQGRVRADWIPFQTPAIQYVRHALSGDIRTADPSVWIGPDRLEKDSKGWSLQLQSDPLGARLQIQDTLTHSAESTESNWQINTLFAGPISGVIRSGTQSAILNGFALGIHRQGNNPPGLRGTQRLGAAVLDKDIRIVIDQSGAQALAFAQIGEQSLNASTAVLKKNAQGIHLDFRPATDLEVLIKAQKPHLRTDPWEHLYAVERWFAGMRFGRPVRRVRAGHADIRLGERRLSAQAVISVNDFK